MEEVTNLPLVIPKEVRGHLVEWVAAGHPHEVCGLLVGRSTGDRFEVVQAAQARNIVKERKRDRYRLAPDDWVAIDNRARADGLDIIGVWHSHPDHPAKPSPTDLEAAWEGYAYLILSVTANGVAELRSWRLSEGKFEEQPIEESES
jgi:proteasome lid subunit RPN8/RPN11